ncbi:MAG: hypothetical protein GF411_04505 [Candidatus Lokiarchaeota archaeon]|nr:hypothetical protein [Candidatus Lokiarchaeota archaeon]
MEIDKVPWTIASLGQLSILLEVSSPKPGNVNRLRRFSDTGYRHFLTSATLFSKGLYHAARRGFEMRTEKGDYESIRVGELIHSSTKDVLTGLNKRNTILGTILLHIPLAIAAGEVIGRKEKFDLVYFRDSIQRIIDSTTVQDTLDVYRSFQLTQVNEQKSHDWSQIHYRYDISNPDVLENIQSDSIRLIELFRISSNVDSIAKEWASYFSITLNETFPYLRKTSTNLDDLEEGIVRSFIWLLSRYPDGLIVKKAGMEKAEEIMEIAGQIHLKYENGVNPEEELEKLDKYLRKDGNVLNPGSTADLISAAIFCRLLELQYD